MIPASIDFHPAAIAEAREARLWYAERCADAAERFLREPDRAVEQVAISPSRWPAYLHGTRHFVFRGFPHAPVYRATRTVLQVVAVPHAKRRPAYWRDRVRD